ncbi:hypothetical protein DXG01_007555 [Tephrocybe rancida]|nr:hypothetical protein DXG01_007555 [Tephrocybe rancida]
MSVFSLYGGFWMSYGTIFIPASGILASYDNAPDELANALGLYLIVWLMVTVMLIFPVARRNLAFTVLSSVLAITFLMLAIAQFTGSEQVTKAGGVFGIITGLIGFYIGVSEIMAAEKTAFMRVPLGAR